MCILHSESPKVSPVNHIEGVQIHFPIWYDNRGWLHIAHGVRNTAEGLRYVIYLFVTDLKEPWKVIAEPCGYFLHCEAGPAGCEKRNPTVA